MMTAIITFKPGTSMAPHKIVNVVAILTTQFTTKFITKNNKVQSMENCDVENVFLENMGK